MTTESIAMVKASNNVPERDPDNGIEIVRKIMERNIHKLLIFLKESNPYLLKLFTSSPVAIVIARSANADQ
jgi:hypothetical protein